MKNWTRLLRLAGVLLVGYLLAACAHTVPIGKVVPVRDGDEMRKGLRAADELMVYEGLPHQTKEKELMESELAKSKTIRIHGYPFYLPPVAAKKQAELKKILGDPRTYKKYTGPKTCGGFHPDYAVFWNEGEVPKHILICFGCGEALFSDGGKLMPFDIRHSQLYKLRDDILAVQHLKRPLPQH